MSASKLTVVYLKALIKQFKLTGYSSSMRKPALVALVEKSAKQKPALKKAIAQLTQPKTSRKPSRKQQPSRKQKPKPRVQKQKPSRKQQPSRKQKPKPRVKSKVQHASHDAVSAVQHLRKLVSGYALSRDCRGNGDFLQSVLGKQVFHPSICTPNHMLSLFYDNDDNESRFIWGQYKDDADRKMIYQHEDGQYYYEKPEKPFSVADYIARCSNQTITAVRLSIGYSDQPGTHANILLINRDKKQVEHFEPHGDRADSFVSSFLEKNVTRDFNLPGYKFISAYDGCVRKLGPQSKTDVNDVPECAGKGGGYCAAFSDLYVELRLLAPDASSAETLNALDALSAPELLDLVRRFLTWEKE